MKKIISLLLALVLCAALAIPAMAVDGYNNGDTIPSGQHDGVWIYDNCNVTIDGAVILTSDSSFRLYTNSTLTIKEGGSLSGMTVVCPHIYENSKIVLNDGGWIKIEFYSNSDANNFEQLLNASGISYTRNGDIVMAGAVPAGYAPEVPGGSTGSTLSQGNMTIVVGVAGLAVGMAVMFFIMKKKPAAANGANSGDEE